MKRLSQKARAILLLAVIAVCAAIGLAGGCKDSKPTTSGKTQIFVTEAAAADKPLDCVPDPDGNILYYIASKGADRAVFKSDADGKVTEVFVGAPLVDARGISISSDGAVLYLADPGAPNGGALYSLDIAGGTPTVITGTEGTAPRALDVLASGKADEIAFVGKAEGGSAAVLKIPAAGGTAAVVYKGSPLVLPDGIVAGASGVYYVSDAGTDPGKTYQIKGTTAKAMGGDIELGAPAGISELMNESAVLVSSLDPQKGTSQVVIIDPSNGSTSIFNGTIGANKASGGLHRAHYANLFGWAGVKSVYRVKVVLENPSSTPGGPGD